MFVRKTFQRMGQFGEPPGYRWLSVGQQRITQTKRRQFDRIHQLSSQMDHPHTIYRLSYVFLRLPT